MTREMTLEEEAKFMQSRGCILRKGTDEHGNPMEYWDVPRTLAEKAAAEKAEKSNGEA